MADEQIEQLWPYLAKSDGNPGVNDQRVLSGILFLNRNERRWRDAPGDHRLNKTLYNRWKR